MQKLHQKKENILYWGLVGLVLYMPFHLYLCELLISFTQLDNILRDGVIMLLFALVAFSLDTYRSPLSISVAVSALLLAGMGAISAFHHKLMPILNVLRTYLVPMLIFFVARQAKMDTGRFQRLTRFFVVELAIVGFYGYFQAFFLGDDFLLRLGYEGNEGYLASTSFYIAYFFGFQRSTGTFISPNICGIVLAMALCVLLFTKKDLTFRRGVLPAACLTLGLGATFSRSAILGAACGMCFGLLMIRFWQHITKKRICNGLVVLGVVAAFLVMDYFVFESLFLRMLLSSMLRVISGEDPSANTHMQHLFNPPTVSTIEATIPSIEATIPSIEATIPSIEATIPSIEATISATVPTETVGTTTPVLPVKQWIPTFGFNGPMAQEFVQNAYMVESSYLLIIGELGSLGAIVYFIPYVLLLVLTVLRRKEYPYFAPATAVLAALVSYVFLPNVQNFEVLFYVFLLMGLYDNPSIRAQYARNNTNCVK